MILIEAFLGALADVVFAAVAARPVLWTSFVVWIFAAGASAWDFLERRPVRGTGFAIASGSAFGLVCALGA